MAQLYVPRAPLEILTPPLIKGVEDAPECITLTSLYMGAAAVGATSRAEATWDDLIRSELEEPYLGQTVQAAKDSHDRLAQQSGKTVREDRLPMIMSAIHRLSLTSVETAIFEFLQGDGGKLRPTAAEAHALTRDEQVTVAITMRNPGSNRDRLGQLFGQAIKATTLPLALRLLGNYAQAIGRNRTSTEFQVASDSTHAKKTHLYYYLRSIVANHLLTNPIRGISPHQTLLFTEHILRPY